MRQATVLPCSAACDRPCRPVRRSSATPTSSTPATAASSGRCAGPSCSRSAIAAPASATTAWTSPPRLARACALRPGARWSTPAARSRALGNLVLVKHPGGWVTAYAHLDRIEVRMRDTVAQGEEIGQAGQTGAVTQPQLHFEVRYAPDSTEKARPVDPRPGAPRQRLSGAIWRRERSMASSSAWPTTSSFRSSHTCAAGLGDRFSITRAFRGVALAAWSA